MKNRSIIEMCIHIKAVICKDANLVKIKCLIKNHVGNGVNILKWNHEGSSIICQ